MKDAAAVGCFSKLLRLRTQQKRSQSTPTIAVDTDVLPSPISHSGTLVEKNDQALPLYASQGGPCCCCGSPITVNVPAKTAPSYSFQERNDIFRPDVLKTIEVTIDELDASLRKLSLDIWEHPEPAYEERYAHDILTAYMSFHGFTVTKHYLGLETAWQAVYTHGKGGRVIGVNSEMDALPGLGHACGHNLIAISGVAVALGLKAALEKHNVLGKIVLLGTPAEETGGGKIKLIEQGAYKEMDACVMTHPGPGTPHGTLIAPWLSLQHIEVEFFGHSAHAAYSPWEAQNALDAAFLAYSSVSVLRQQMKPSYRVHGVVMGKDWEPNVIPDYAKMRWIVRAPTWAEVKTLRERVTACFQAAALATGCKFEIKLADGYKDVRENTVLGEEYCKVVESQYSLIADTVAEVMSASTDFGNVSYELPSLQPVYTIPTEPNGSNHTPQFTKSARLPESHEACITVSKGLAMTAFRVLADEEFYLKVRKAYEDRQKLP